MRHEVVGVIRPRAGVLEAAEDLSRQQAASDDTVAPVLVARDFLQDGVDVIVPERRSLAIRPPDRGLRIDRRVLRIETGQERFHLVVAEGVEDLGCDGDGSGRGLGIFRRIEFDEPGMALGVHGREARVSAGRFLADQDPFRRIRWLTDICAANELVVRERPGADAVREPARVGDLVDGVDVLRAQAARLVAGVDEQVVRQFEGLRALVRGCFRRILRLRCARDRIVGIETRALRRADGAKDANRTGRQSQERRMACTCRERCIQHESLPRRTRTTRR